MRKCGLKSLHTSPILHGQGVTSLAEVWIEMYVNEQVDGETAVTSLAEVWIEIFLMRSEKLAHSVTSLAEVWIEIELQNTMLNAEKSLPLRKCGLK